MAIGGRPEEEGGHGNVNLSLNEATRKGLIRLGQQGVNRSETVENALQNIVGTVEPVVLGTVEASRGTISSPVSGSVSAVVRIEGVSIKGTIVTIIPALVGAIQALTPDLETVLGGSVGTVVRATLYLTITISGSITGSII